VSHATTRAQETLLTNLGESVLAARRAGISTPATIVIGAPADPCRIFPWFVPVAEHAQADQTLAAIEHARGLR
jgi:siroheme synthase